MARIAPINVATHSAAARADGQEVIAGRLVTGTATFSPCKLWRYRLTRTWAEGRGACLWIMLNPSTADAAKVDPTVRRAMTFSMRWGYREGWVANVFAIRATDPKNLYDHTNPIGPDNDRAIMDMTSRADRIVLAWGNHGRYGDRFRQVLELVGPWRRRCGHLGLTGEGMPRHPLYVRGDTAFNQAWLG